MMTKIWITKCVKNIVGHYSLVFHWYHEKNERIIRNGTKICKEVVGFNANNTFYLCMGADAVDADWNIHTYGIQTRMIFKPVRKYDLAALHILFSWVELLTLCQIGKLHCVMEMQNDFKSIPDAGWLRKRKVWKLILDTGNSISSEKKSFIRNPVGKTNVVFNLVLSRDLNCGDLTLWCWLHQPINNITRGKHVMRKQYICFSKLIKSYQMKSRTHCYIVTLLQLNHSEMITFKITLKIITSPIFLVLCRLTYDAFIEEPKYIVFESKLMELFSRCGDCKGSCRIIKFRPKAFGSGHQNALNTRTYNEKLQILYDLSASTGSSKICLH